MDLILKVLKMEKSKIMNIKYDYIYIYTNNCANYFY